MTDAVPSQTKEFQAETRQILKLVIHSLYSNKEIFLRELISNSADACEKLRFTALSQPELLDGNPTGVTLIPDAAAGTLTLKDNGIGMSADEVSENLGTIARSGTKRFMEALSGDNAKDSALIGQFGVGFYSAFIVADKVTVLTKRADTAGVRWDSDGEGSYTIAAHHKADRGTEVILHLRDDDKEFLDADRLRALVHKYSDHLSLPISLQDGETTEVVNQAKALWTRSKNEITDDEYKAFYKHISHDWQDPVAWAHHRVEGAQEYTSLLFLPAKAPFDMFDREQEHGVQLYVKRVFIMDKAAELLPPWLRFMRGLVDSADLPLNVSRELLQGNRMVDKIKTALVKRALDLLEDIAENQPEKFADFYKNFGQVLKEGIIDDETNRPRIAKLLRFASTHTPEINGNTLAAYVGRMQAEQTHIYYVTADTLAAARNSPHLEGFAAKGIEVLLLTDRIDDWVVSHLREFDGKTLQSIAKGAPDLDSKIETPEKAEAEASFKPTIERVKTSLGEKVSEVRLSTRLTESPACLVVGEHDMSLRMTRMLKAAGQGNPFTKAPIIELNPKHPLVLRLQNTANDNDFADLAGVLHDQALLAEGGLLEDPASFVKKINQLIVAQATEAPRIIL